MLSVSRIKEIIAEDAKMAAEKTTCLRKGVACTLLFPFKYGYETRTQINGLPFEGAECSNVKGNCGCMHAEQKALMQLDRIEMNCVMLVSYSPCTQCANHLILRLPKVKAVVYITPTEHDMRGLERIKKFIPAYQIEELTDEIVEEWHKINPKTF